MIKQMKPPRLSDGTVAEKRAQIKAYFTETWELYESLFTLIDQDEAYFLRPEPLRHPLIFYYGHTAVFYINKLILGKYIQARVEPELESICAVGVDEMSWDDLKPDNYQWPSVERVRAYRNQVKALVLDLIESMPLNLPITQDSLAWIILMGCEHERIHLETSSVIMRMMSLEYLSSKAPWRSCQVFADAPINPLLPVNATQVSLGKPASNDTYGWDNEYGELKVDVEQFAASQYLTSNGEYLEFIRAGGYQTPDYWDEEGQSWLEFTQSKHPKFWLMRNGEYFQRNLCDEIPLPLNWPVEVNYLEAKAFCNWKAQTEKRFIRLPTEAEWQVLRDDLPTDLQDWQQAPGNINLEYFASSCAVDKYPQGQFYDVIGNVWQWTESPIDGYPGFNVHPLYDDFSTPTFDGKHNLIKGGSWISTGNEATRDSRYAFRRHFFQHAGFRYVQAQSPEAPFTPVSLIESQVEVSRQLHHHYPQSGLSSEHDLQTLLAAVLAHSTNKGRALDLGCGVGRFSFELAKHYAHVDGIDFTARHIQHCLALKEQGQLRYAMPTQGELVNYFEIKREQIGFAQAPDNLDFFQGDAHNLKPQFSNYDLIVCHSLLEYLYDPAGFLSQLHTRVANGGVLVLSSAYQWSSEFTETDKWLGGVKQDGENLDSRTQIMQLLAEHFELIADEAITVKQMENARRSTLIENDVLIFKRRL